MNQKILELLTKLEKEVTPQGRETLLALKRELMGKKQGGIWTK